MRNVDEVVFSKVLGECVSDLRHSGWRLDELGFGSGPCIWGTCAFNGDRKMGIQSQNLSFPMSSFLFEWIQKRNLMTFLTMPQICTYSFLTSECIFLNSSQSNEYGEDNKITYNQMCLWNNAVDTLAVKNNLCLVQISVAKFVWV